ncbi:MAG: glycoside hydrolase family 127 protein [Bacteroidetes bacterium]|nr:glycoside hydrolase family 127 protein [Fibrella sp.]
MKTFVLLTGLLTLFTGFLTPPPTREVAVVDRPATTSRNAFYVSNAAPLQPEHFVKLPIGSIRPGGWLRETLDRQANGLAGHLGEISIWLTKENNAWLNKAGKGDYGWEELPYWLKGYGDMAYVLNRPDMLAETNLWLDGTINSQRDTGDFGPVVMRNGKRDLWAQMLMLFCLQSSYEHRADPRVLTLMSRYFAWQNQLPDDQFLEGYWENSRGGDNLFSVYWLYNRTNEPFLLDLATKIHRNTANWRQADNLPNWHNVNIAQCFREPATYFLQSHDPADLRATYRDHELVRQRYGQVPGGMWGGDEYSRVGYTDPRQAVETCGMVEQMASDELLMRFTGDPFWAENCEDVAFNTLPAAFMPDYRSLRYLTAPNMVVSDAKNHSPGLQNEGPFLMMNPFSSRCCQHNHSNGWVYYAENLWMATPDNGLAAVLYNTSTVTANVGAAAGNGVPGDASQTVTLAQETGYPFEEQVRLIVTTARPVRFPLYLRIPAWCQTPTVRINGKTVPTGAKAGQYVVLTDTWKSGDRITLDLPMRLAVRTWDQNKNSVSVNYGPLTYSLKIGEDYRQEDSQRTAIGDSKWQPTADPTRWPSFEIYPQSAWNYGLVLNQARPEESFTVVRKPGPMSAFPFTADASPISLRAKARRIPSWVVDQYGLCSVLPQSPVDTAEPLETVTLVPMGAARLRISAFPTVTK